MHAHGQRHGTALAIASRVGRLVQPSATLHAELSYMYIVFLICERTSPAMRLKTERTSRDKVQ